MSNFDGFASELCKTDRADFFRTGLYALPGYIKKCGFPFSLQKGNSICNVAPKNLELCRFVVFFRFSFICAVGRRMSIVDIKR